MTALATTNGTGIPRPVEMPRSEAIERALINGDLSGLSPRERMDFYQMRCDAAGLDPRSQPFQYLQLPARGKEPAKLVLYATKATGDQLIAKHRLSVKILKRGYDEEIGCYVAEAQATFPHGQSVEDIGAVFIGEDAWGELKANSVMKCVTKAKRRTVLSACGLGMLDETEIDSIPGAVRVDPEHTRIIERPPGPALVHEPTNEPRSQEVSEAKQWVKGAIQMANDKLKNIFLIEGKGDKYEPTTNIFQVCNHLVSTWIEDGVLQESEILNVKGKRDAAKVGAAVQVAWHQDQAEVKQDVWAYLHGKARKECEALGVEWTEDEPKLPEALAGTTDDAFEEGRE